MNKAAYFYLTEFCFLFSFSSSHIGVAEQSFDRAELWSGTIPPPVHWTHLLVDLAGCGEIMSQLHPVGYRHQLEVTTRIIHALLLRCEDLVAFSPNPQRDVPVFADSELIVVFHALFFAVSNTIEHVRDGLKKNW